MRTLLSAPERSIGTRNVKGEPFPATAPIEASCSSWPAPNLPTRGAVMAFQQGTDGRSYALDSQSAIMEVRRPSQTDYFSM
jgi:hypothetical protein